MSATPGPWKVLDGLRTHIFTNGDAYGRGPMFVAEIRGWGHLTGRGGGCAMAYEDAVAIQEANARLIAAAPDLLRELKKFVVEADARYYGRQPNFGTLAAHEAIAKAEGRAALQSASGSPEDAT